MRRELTSSATFYLGEVLTLRPDMGGGRWRVVEILPRDGGFPRCIAEKLDTSTGTAQAEAEKHPCQVCKKPIPVGIGVCIKCWEGRP